MTGSGAAYPTEAGTSVCYSPPSEAGIPATLALKDYLTFNANIE